VLSDYSLPGFSGLRALEMVRARCPDTPFIFVSGTIGEERAIEALKLGANDYVLKDRRARLLPAIRLVLREAAAHSARRRAEMELAASERRFNAFMQHLAGAAYMKDIAGRFTFVNGGVARIIGRAPEECLGRKVEELFPPEYARQYSDNDRDALASGAPVERIEHVPFPDGVHSFLTHKFPIWGSDDTPVAVGGIALDVTERLQQQEKIARLSRVHAMLSGINAAIIRIRDRRELFRAVCRIAVRQGGFGMAWIGALDADSRRHEVVAVAAAAEETEATVLALAAAAIGQASHPAERALRSKSPQVLGDLRQTAEPVDAPAKYHSIAALPMRVGGDASGVLVLYAAEPDFFDREEVKLLEELAADASFALDYMDKEERLSYVSYYDTLTGLANRHLFFDRLTQMLDAARGARENLAVIVVDLRRFRNVNDAVGRAGGDRYLKDFAACMQPIFPKQATTARVSGDRFAVAIGDTQAPAVAHLVEAWISAAAALPFAVQGVELRVAFKAGIAMFPADGTDAETLFRNAEAALQRAKDTVDTYAFYAPEMNARVAERMLLESRLLAAWEQKHFQVYYQPKFDLVSRGITGFEALIRWPDPGGGMVSPAVFVPLLEQSGLIVDVGDWVLRRVLADIATWRACGLAVPPVAVNVSQVQLRQKDFVANTLAALDDAGVEAPARIDLEITESLVMQDVEAVIAKLVQLRARGLRIHMDDFGTGYSSLSQIARLPLDALKIDRAFIQGMTAKAESLAIVSTIISLAQALGIVMIAEGVETEEQAGLLASLNCQQAQGYLVSPAVPADAAAAFLDAAA
jgi:diguanylate cyclase (GGDEF)-like protein/PAS domain S-box-containing protein